MRIPFLTVMQPIGTFYMTSIKASDLANIVKVIPRSVSNEGVQRDLSSINSGGMRPFLRRESGCWKSAISGCRRMCR